MASKYRRVGGGSWAAYKKENSFPWGFILAVAVFLVMVTAFS